MVSLGAANPVLELIDPNRTNRLNHLNKIKLRFMNKQFKVLESMRVSLARPAYPSKYIPIIYNLWLEGLYFDIY